MGWVARLLVLQFSVGCVYGGNYSRRGGVRGLAGGAEGRGARRGEGGEDRTPRYTPRAHAPPATPAVVLKQ